MVDALVDALVDAESVPELAPVDASVPPDVDAPPEDDVEPLVELAEPLVPPVPVVDALKPALVAASPPSSELQAPAITLNPAQHSAAA